MPVRRDNPLQFSRAERKFVIVGMCLAAILWTSPYWLNLVLGPGQLPEAESAETLAEYGSEIDAWIARANAVDDSVSTARAQRDSAYAARKAYAIAREQAWAANKSKKRPARKPRQHWRTETWATPLPPTQSIDINQADSSSLRRLGIPPYVVARLLKYRNKAGGFKRKEQIAKLYGLDDSTFQRIERYVDWTLLDQPVTKYAEQGAGGPGRRPWDSPVEARQVSEQFTMEETPKSTWTTTAVELNDASEEDLTAIRGIGDFYARQILDYRDRLGGFSSVEQVREVPKLRAGAVDEWIEQLIVTPGELQRLALNTADARTLARHPYLPFRKAQTLVNYRTNHGPFAAPADLYKVVALDSALIVRMLPYLSFN